MGYIRLPPTEAHLAEIKARKGNRHLQSMVFLIYPGHGSERRGVGPLFQPPHVEAMVSMYRCMPLAVLATHGRRLLSTQGSPQPTTSVIRSLRKTVCLRTSSMTSCKRETAS